MYTYIWRGTAISLFVRFFKKKLLTREKPIKVKSESPGHDLKLHPSKKHDVFKLHESRNILELCQWKQDCPGYDDKNSSDEEASVREFRSSGEFGVTP